MSGKVFLVGAGPGDPGLLTQKAARAIAQCEVLVYDYLASEPIIALAGPYCEKIYVGKKAGAHTLSQQAIIELLVRLGKEGRRIVRLKGGDVFVFARGGEEAQALHDAGVAFEIIPGITSALAAPAYATTTPRSRLPPGTRTRPRASPRSISRSWPIPRRRWSS
jgi:uroporphyrinogen III methyltransferase/synthase